MPVLFYSLLFGGGLGPTPAPSWELGEAARRAIRDPGAVTPLRAAEMPESIRQYGS